MAPKTRALVRQSMLIVAVHTQRHVVVGVGESDSSACRKERRESEFGARLSNHFTGRLAGAGAQHVFNSRGRLNQHRGRAECDPDSKLGVQHHLHTGAERRTQSTRGAHTRKRSEGGRIADRNTCKLPGAAYRDVETCQRHSEKEKSRRLMDSDVVGRARHVECVLLRANNAGGVVAERRTVVGDRSDRAAHQRCVITDQNSVVVARVCGRRAKKQN